MNQFSDEKNYIKNILRLKILENHDEIKNKIQTQNPRQKRWNEDHLGSKIRYRFLS